MWHSLDENGKIEIYDVRWPNGTIETNIPVGLLESVREGKHNEGEQHGVQEKDIPVNERKYKGKTMKITKRQLRRIVKEEKTKVLREQEDMSSNTTPTNNEHHWPRVEWSNVGELVDKWTQTERDAFNKGDPSMMAMGETATEAKGIWDMQVEQAGMEMEAELTARVRKVALQTMQEFTDNLINGDYT